MIWPNVVSPVETGVQIIYNHFKILNSGFRQTQDEFSGFLRDHYICTLREFEFEGTGTLES